MPKIPPPPEAAYQTTGRPPPMIQIVAPARSMCHAHIMDERDQSVFDAVGEHLAAQGATCTNSDGDPAYYDPKTRHSSAIGFLLVGLLHTAELKDVAPRYPHAHVRVASIYDDPTWGLRERASCGLLTALQSIHDRATDEGLTGGDLLSFWQSEGEALAVERGLNLVVWTAAFDDALDEVLP